MSLFAPSGPNPVLRRDCTHIWGSVLPVLHRVLLLEKITVSSFLEIIRFLALSRPRVRSDLRYNARCLFPLSFLSQHRPDHIEKHTRTSTQHTVLRGFLVCPAQLLKVLGLQILWTTPSRQQRPCSTALIRVRG